MEKESGHMLPGCILLLCLLVVLISIFGGIRAILQAEFIGAGLLLLSASIPIGIAINRILKH